MTTGDHIPQPEPAPAPADQPKPADDPTAPGELRAIDPERYTLGRELAKTAILRVVEARDRRHDRAVAVKQLIVRSPERRARFEREARILARLQHPSIVGVLEVGTWPGGEPCIVMKLVTGERIDQLIAREPTLDDRLALLPRAIAIVDAIAYAHARGVIHRDLHPGNVIAGELGETVVVGWGLVKELSDPPAPVSGPALAVGTRPSEAVEAAATGAPAYSPIEQLTGKPVDVRADVYALGALLHHLITGEPPYSALAPELVAQAVIAGPPQPIDPRLGAPPELVAIAARAMARDAADRYPTARELAEALAQFHAGRLIGGTPARRAGRGRRVAIAAAAGLGLVAAGGLAVRHLIVDRARIDDERRLAARDRDRAEAVTSFALADLRAKLAPIGKLDLIAPSAKKAAEYYAGRAGEVQPQELVGLGDLLADQGDLGGALAQYEAALALVEAGAASEPGAPAWQQALAAAHQRVSGTRLRRGDLKPALASARTSIDIAMAMVKRDPKGAAPARALAMGKLLVGRVLAAQDHTAGALIELRAGLAALDKLAAAHPDDAELATALAESEVHAGDVLARAKDPRAAIEQYQASLSIRQRLATADPSSTVKKHALATAYTRVGAMLETQGHVNNALNAYRKAKTILLALVASDPANAVWQLDLEHSHLQVGRTARLDGNVPAAIADLRAALAIAALLSARDPAGVPLLHELAGLHMQLGDTLWEQGDKPAALDELRAAIAVADTVAKLRRDDATERVRAEAHASIGAILLSRADAPGALASYQACAAAYEQLGDRDPEARRALAHAHERIGDVLRNRRDLPGAVEQQRAALAILQQLSPGGRDVAAASDKLGDLQLWNRDAKATIESYRAALAVLEALAAKEPANARAQDDVARAHDKLADPLLMVNDPDTALAELRASLEIRDRLAAAAPSDVASQVAAIKAHERLGDGLFAKRDLAAARAESRVAFMAAMKLVPKLPQAEAQQLVMRLRWKALR